MTRNKATKDSQMLIRRASGHRALESSAISEFQPGYQDDTTLLPLLLLLLFVSESPLL